MLWSKREGRGASGGGTHTTTGLRWLAALWYKFTLAKPMIHSMHLQGDDLVVDVDGGLSVK